MIPPRDFSVLLTCTHSTNWSSWLLCEFPDACNGCLYHDTHGTHNVKKALKAYHEYQKELDNALF